MLFKTEKHVINHLGTTPDRVVGAKTMKFGALQPKNDDDGTGSVAVMI